MSTSFGQTSSARSSTPSRGAGSESVASVAVPRKLLWWLTIGVAGTVLFAVFYLIEGAIRPGYSLWQQTISSLSFGPEGWMQRANFIFCGVSVLWLAYVWRQILKGGVCATWYPIVHTIEGVGLVALGIFRLDPFHTVSMTVTIIGMTLSLLIIARRFWGDPRWRGWGFFAVACGVWPSLVMPLFGLALNPQSVFSGLTGLIERLATSPDIVWGVVILIPLWAGRPLMRPTA
jgi:hypothetical membrane protein